MQFKKVDVLISENLTKEQLKEKVLTELNKISKESNPSISYIANIHDIVNGKYWICMDSETKETMEASDELIDLQAIFRHTTENPEEASKDLLYSSKYIEDNFLRKIIFETYKEANDSRLTKLETTVGTNEKDIEDKHYKLERRVTTAENTIAANKELEDTRYSEYTQFKKNIENNILSINNNLNTKANLGGSETQVFNVADPTSDWHAINLAYAKKNFNVDLINTHKTDFNNPHKTSIANLIDASIVDPTNNHILQYDSNTKKWKNAVLSVDLSNYYNKSEVDSKLDTKANTSNVYNKSEINTKFNSYYNKSTIDSFMELKASAESVYDKSEIDTKLQDVLTQADNRYSTLLTQKLEWTVGEGGNFENIDDAINEIYKYGKSIYDITLKIKNGYTITKPTTFYNLPLGVNIVGENGRSDELIIDLNNTAWAQFGLYIVMCEVHIHDITIRASSNNCSSIYISTGTNGSIYNVDLIGMSLTNLVIASSGNIEVSNINIQNNYQGAEECYDLSVLNANLQIGANVKFLSNNPEKLVAISAATNSKISSVWWHTGIDISGNYKVGLQVVGGGVINNPSIAMTGNIGTKFSQTPGQWTTSGYISTNI